MADEKILKDEILKDEQVSDEELEQVAGGFYARSNVGDVKSDVNASNPEYPKQSRLIIIE